MGCLKLLVTGAVRSQNTNILEDGHMWKTQSDFGSHHEAGAMGTAWYWHRGEIYTNGSPGFCYQDPLIILKITDDPKVLRAYMSYRVMPVDLEHVLVILT